MSFKWLRGGATTFAQLGDPSTTDDYALCVFDTTGTPSLLLEAAAPFGETCVGKPCWKRLGSATSPKGWKYGDKDGTPDGITELLVNSGAAGKSKLLVKGKGANLPIGTSTSVLPNAITTQVQSTNGTCWSAACSTIIRNAGGQFECKGE